MSMPDRPRLGRTSSRPQVQINLRMAAVTYDSLARSAKARGYSPTGYATLLFEAAFAARIGQERGAPVSDAELDDQVRLVFALAGQADPEAIGKATGIGLPTVRKILDGWAAYAKSSNSKGVSV